MVGGFDDVQRCSGAQFCADGAQQVQMGEGVARSLFGVKKGTCADVALSQLLKRAELASAEGNTG